MFYSLGGTITLIVVVVVVLLLVLWGIGVYNKLVKSRNKVRNSWSQIDVQLKRRFDLVPNLVETVKGYASHEKEIFNNFAEARKMYQSGSEAASPETLAKADAMLSRAINIVVERYPELKADQSFLKLQNELSETENKIAFTRQFYNDVVLSYNNEREVFPSTIIASLFKFKAAEFFKIDGEEAKAPKISF
ncbi:MAG: LemA family protein [Methanomicrobia archaeon]|jgi:LemA protein|nr:LemA family protein [Methanomicrobia archaeon]